MVSIIIPTYNRAASLHTTLQSIIRLDSADDDFEVIVIDNGSTDNTSDVCNANRGLIKKFTYNYNNMPGLLTGRHAGAQLAKGDILAFIDDDVELSANWLSGIRQSFSNNEVSLLTGPCLPKYQSTPPQWLNYFWDHTPYGGKACTWLSLMDLGDQVINIHPNYVWGLNFIIRKDVFWRLGGFHPDCIPEKLQQYQGDGETGLTIKALKMGLIAQYNPQIMLHHVVPAQRLTLAYFEKRAFYQGVCNSFTDIRTKNLAPAPVKSITPGYLNFPGKIYRRLKRSLFTTKNRNEPAEIVKIKATLSNAEQSGYQFHQNAFNTDTDVRQWVLKKDFFNYNLPNL